MILPDVNILIHAYNRESPQNQAAREWWEQTLTLSRPVGLPWVTILGFIRITTKRTLTKNPRRPAEAIGLVRSWLAVPTVQILTPGEMHAELLFRLLEQAGAAGDLTTDAHLAALAIEYQAELASTDTDFTRFPGLRWFNPVRI
jgi:hypothetical protein